MVDIVPKVLYKLCWLTMELRKNNFVFVLETSMLLHLARISLEQLVSSSQIFCETELSKDCIFHKNFTKNQQDTRKLFTNSHNLPIIGQSLEVQGADNR